MSGPRPAPDLTALFSDAVAYELAGNELDGTGLWPEEEQLVARAVDNRRYQFAAGRSCARAGLTHVGLAAGPILTARQREPAWPQGARGSISHTDGYVVAVVRRIVSPGPDGAIDRLAIGIDAEQVGRVDDHLYDRLFTGPERAWLAQLDPARRSEAATAVFSAKEAFYKAQFALTGAWVGFHDVESTPADTGLVLRPCTDLDALTAVRWPCQAHHLVRQLTPTPVLVSAVEVRGR